MLPTLWQASKGKRYLADRADMLTSTDDCVTYKKLGKNCFCVIDHFINNVSIILLKGWPFGHISHTKDPSWKLLNAYMLLEEWVFLRVEINSNWLTINERMNIMMRDRPIPMRVRGM